MQHRAAKRQTLLPSTGELRPEPVQIRFETIHLDDVVHAFFQTVRTESVNSAVEREIFFNTEVGVQAEILRHVADSLAHPFRIRAHVQSFDAGLASAQRKQTGQHFDHCGFAAAVGPEKTKNFSARDREADVVYGGKVSEFSHQPACGNCRISSF